MNKKIKELSKIFKSNLRISPVNVLSIYIVSSLFFLLLNWFFSKIQLFNNLSLKYNLTINSNQLFHPGSDLGYLENFQYHLEIWIAITAFLIFRRFKIRNTLFITFIYIFILLDDFYDIHTLFVNNFITFESFANIRVQDIYELVFWLFIVLLISIIFYFNYKKASKKGKRFIKINFLLISLLAFFGIIIDLLAYNIPIYSNYYYIKGFFTFFEEFGEAGTLSITLIWMFNILTKPKLMN